MKIRSVKFKISIFLTTILGVILILYSGLLFFGLYHSLYEELDRDLRLKKDQITGIVKAYAKALPRKQTPPEMLFKTISAFDSNVLEEVQVKNLQVRKKMIYLQEAWQETVEKLKLKEDFFCFSDADRTSFTCSVNVPLEMEKMFSNIILEHQQGTFFKNIVFIKKDLRLLQSDFSLPDGSRHILLLATSQSPVMEILKKRLVIILATIPFILIIYGFLGRYIAIKILGPMDKITQTAKYITHKNLSRRLEFDYADEEMKPLVDAFNEMIARLQKSFDHIEKFSSEVAHELKTPIAIIRGECELALRKPREPEEYKRVIRVNLEETRRLLKTVEDLLLLSKLDYRPEIFKFERVEGLKFFKDISEQAKILASEKNIRFEAMLPDRKFFLKADAVHLRRLYFNIIHNAIKFTPLGGVIRIEIQLDAEGLTSQIRDNGIGISKEDIPKVFNRFFHKDLTGESTESSNGLGLNIALSIAKIHRGDIYVQSRLHQGTVFTVFLPLC